MNPIWVEIMVDDGISKKDGEKQIRDKNAQSEVKDTTAECSFST